MITAATPIQLATRMARIKPSATMAVAAKAAQLRAQGKDIINLSIGEPDFDTAQFIKSAAIDALQHGLTKYTAVDGTHALKAAIINKLKRDNQLQYEAKDIIVSCGAKHSIYNCLQVLLNPGDEVIIPAPYWVSYPEMVELAEAHPILLSTTYEQGLKITAEQLNAAITPKTKLLIINSPSNPTGLIYSREELLSLAAVLMRHPHVCVLTDDIYEYIRWNNQAFDNLVSVCPELKQRTIVVNGVSKAYAMTGWRIGYAAGPRAIIQAMADLQSQSTSNPNSIAQAAAAAALNADPTTVQPMVDAFHSRHQFVYAQLSQLAGVRVLPADGAFYSFPDFSHVIEQLPGMTNDIELAEYFLEHAGVALVPGTPFGAPGYLRLSFATSQDLLEQAFERLRTCLQTE